MKMRRNHRKYRYDIASALLPYEDRDHFVKVRLLDLDGKELYEITTNKALEGLFVWYPGEQRYQQISGTCDYSLPASASSIRAKLRNEYEKLHGISDKN